MKACQIRTSISQIALSLTLLLLLNLPMFGQTATQPEIKPPLTDQPVEYKIDGDKKHHYKIDLKSNEFVQVRAEQKDVDVLLRLLDASGNELAQMNFHNRKDVVETLSFVAIKAGTYTLEVSLFDAKAKGGSYTIRREALRTAKPQDKRRVEVERLFAEAMLERSKEGHLDAAIKKLLEALIGWQELADSYMADLTAWKIKQSKALALYFEAREIEAGQKAGGLRAAREKYVEATRLFREAGDLFGELGSLLGASIISQTLEEYKAEIEFNKQTLPIFRALPGSHQDEIQVLDRLARGSLKIGDKYSALEYFIQALPIYRELKNPLEEAKVENDIGALYQDLGQKEEALKYLNQALPHMRELGNKCGIRGTLNNIGLVYSSSGKKTLALSFLKQALPPPDSTDNDCGAEKVATLTNIGQVYNDLGEHNLAITEYLEPSLKLLETMPDKSLTAATLNNIGNAYYALGKNPKALESYEHALLLFKDLRDEKNAAIALSNIGIVYSVQGENQLAIKRLKESLEIRRSVGDKDGEAIALNNIGEVYLALGNKPDALKNFNQALPLFKAAGDRTGEAIALSNEMAVWNLLGNRRLAIFYGKLAVNNLQELRGAARGLENEIQKNYLRTVKRSYQQLAELLIEEGLYDQAVQVLNFYQDEQFFDFNLDPRSSVQQTVFSSHEYNVDGRYEAASTSLGQTGSQIQELQRQFSYRPPTDEQTAELQKLQEKLKTATDIFLAVLKDAENEFAKPSSKEDSIKNVPGVSEMQGALDKLGGWKQKTVALYTLIGNDRFYILLLKPDSIEAFSNPTKAEDLKGKIRNLFEPLTDRRITGAGLLTPLSALYDIIFKSTSIRDKTRTLAMELEQYKPDVLLWSLDGNLRYIPVAALYDANAKQYLVEKYQNVVFTRAEKDRFLRDHKSWTGGIGFGKSNASTKVFCESPKSDSQPTAKASPERTPLPALPAVAEDLPVIARILETRPLLNDEFNRQSLIDSIKGKNRPLVHISSHFCFQAGDATKSFLLLGDDNILSLSELKDYPHLFDGVDLLVLSACQTAAFALQDEMDTGKEIDSLAELSQRLGASSVIATLWNADAAGSGKLMIEMYRLQKERPEMSKAELLRQAQLSFLKGKIPSKQNIDHPFYWAPFVLYGNFR